MVPYSMKSNSNENDPTMLRIIMTDTTENNSITSPRLNGLKMVALKLARYKITRVCNVEKYLLY